MPKIILDLTDDELNSLCAAVEDQHANYSDGACCPEDEDEFEREGPLAASVFDKLQAAMKVAK